MLRATALTFAQEVKEIGLDLSKSQIFIFKAVYFPPHLLQYTSIYYLNQGMWSVRTACLHFKNQGYILMASEMNE